jgi:uncharacterized BrkB/YihY/UPF0761 family membrane protein
MLEELIKNTALIKVLLVTFGIAALYSLFNKKYDAFSVSTFGAFLMAVLWFVGKL